MAENNMQNMTYKKNALPAHNCEVCKYAKLSELEGAEQCYCTFTKRFGSVLRGDSCKHFWHNRREAEPKEAKKKIARKRDCKGCVFLKYNNKVGDLRKIRTPYYCEKKKIGRTFLSAGTTACFEKK